MDEKELKALIDGSNAKLDKINELLEKKANIEVIEAKYKELTDALEKLSKENGEAAEKIQKQMDSLDVKVQNAGFNGPEGQKTVSQQLKEMLTSDNYKMACKSKSPTEFEIKANEITTSNSFTETNGAVIARMYEPGVVSAPQRETAIWDLISKGSTNSDYVIATERSSQTIGATATNVTEAGVFGQSYGGYTTYKYGVHKIAEYLKVAQEKLEDWEYVRGEIMDMLMTNIPHIRESKILTGYDASINWAGIINTTAQVAKDFAVPTGFQAVSFGNYFDVLRAAILQVRLGNTSLANKRGWNANGILVNPVDAANMELIKDENGQYVLPPFSAPNGAVIRGVRVVESDYITADEFIVGDFTAAKAWLKRSLTIKMWDQNDTDPIYDLVTFTASHRLAFGIGAVRAYAFVYGKFSTAKAAVIAGA